MSDAQRPSRILNGHSLSIEENVGIRKLRDHWNRSATRDSHQFLRIVSVAGARVVAAVDGTVVGFRGEMISERGDAHIGTEARYAHGRADRRRTSGVEENMGARLPETTAERRADPRPGTVTIARFRLVIVSRVRITPRTVDILDVRSTSLNSSVGRSEIQDSFRREFCQWDFRSRCATCAIRISAILTAIGQWRVWNGWKDVFTDRLDAIGMGNGDIEMENQNEHQQLPASKTRIRHFDQTILSTIVLRILIGCRQFVNEDANERKVSLCQPTVPQWPRPQNGERFAAQLSFLSIIEPSSLGSISSDIMTLDGYHTTR